MTEIKIRLACESDYENVLEMSQGIYDGHDYLPFVYHKWLKMPNRLIFVAELEGKLVGLRAINIIEDGKTFIPQAERIHREFRGRGYFKKLKSHVDAYVQRNYPSVNLMRFVAAEENVMSMGMATKTNCRRVLNVYELVCNVDSRLISLETLQDLSGGNASLVYSYTKKQVAENIISKPDVIDMLFTKGLALIKWEVYKAGTISNIDYLFEDGDRMFADRIPLDCSVGKCPTSFSHGRRNEREKFTFWSTTVYTEDPKLFTAHVIQQLKTALQEIQDKFVFSLSLSRKLTSECHRLVEGELGLKVARPLHIVVFEKEFPLGD